MDGAHHPLGPSGFGQWSACPGSVAAQAELPDSTSFFAAEGTCAHHVASEVLSGNANFGDYLGRVLEFDGFKVTVDATMLDYVQRYIDYTNELPAGVTLVEQRVSLDPWIPDGYGTADHIRLTPEGALHVTDLKYGKGVRVEAENNGQLRLYGIGVVNELSYLYDFDTVVLTIHQPRLDHVSSETLSLDDLLEWGERVKTAASAALAPNAPRIPGETQCRWCRAKATCAELQASVRNAVETFPIQDGHKGLDLAWLPNALALVDMAKGWAKAVEAFAFESLQAGEEVRGYKLVAGRGSRKWAEPEVAEKRLRRLLKTDVACPRSLISPAQAEKLMKKDFSKVSPLVAHIAGKPTLAPEGDKRPALMPADVGGFENLDQEN